MTTLWTWTTITDIPVKVFTNSILPFCEAKDVISLCCTNKFFAFVATNETFWKRKLAIDYNFPVLGTARTSGWKFIYQKLRNSRVFVWGCVTLSPSYYGGAHFFINALMRARRNCSDIRTMVNSGYYGFQRQPAGMFLFRLNFTFQVFVWSAWQQVASQCRFGFYSFISYCPCIPTVLPTRLTLMVVCMYGVGAFDPFHFALKSSGIANAFPRHTGPARGTEGC